MGQYNAVKYFQGVQEYFITVLPFKILNQISKVLVYGDDPFGYQRALNPTHYKKIFKSLKDSQELISPTSIILGVNRSDFKEREIPINENMVKVNINENECVFRIIDGQHRLKGLQLAADQNEDLKDYNLSVIIMVIEDEDRRKEVKVFNNINSKAKPLKMDLTILALYKYDILEKVREFDIKEHVSVKVAHFLNEKSDSVWRNAIQLDVNNSNSLGIIGFKSFYESIKPICQLLVKEASFDDRSLFDEILSFVDTNANYIVDELLLPCWNMIQERWPECFKKSIDFDNYEEIETYFNNTYYIQKTMGAKSINGLIHQMLASYEGNIAKTIDNFKERINKSNLRSVSWEIGGLFSGLSSEAGLKKIREMI